MSTEYRERGLQSTERSFESYLESLNLSSDDLKDKKILDVGSGAGVFAAEAKGRGVEDVVSLDPGFESRELRERSRKFGAGAAVAGYAEELPFKNESFDLILNNFSVPMWSKTPEAMEQAFHEELRALRPGGEVRIGPVMVVGETVTGYFDFTPGLETDERFVETWDKMMEGWKNDPSLEVRVIENQKKGQNTLIIRKLPKK